MFQLTREQTEKTQLEIELSEHTVSSTGEEKTPISYELVGVRVY
jgi:hypothetical protein